MSDLNYTCKIPFVMWHNIIRAWYLITFTDSGIGVGNLGGHFWVLSTLLLQVEVDGGVRLSLGRLSCLPDLGVTVRFIGWLRPWLSGGRGKESADWAKVSAGPILPFGLVLVLVVASGNSLVFSELMYFQYISLTKISWCWVLLLSTEIGGHRELMLTLLVLLGFLGWMQ